MKRPRLAVSSEPWYRQGLRFTCTQCGNCCTGSAGTVRVTDAEIEALARRLELSDEEFRTAYTRQLPRGEISLRERRGGACVFYSRDEGCTVYEDRPHQCRTWPFWRSVTHSEERWAEEALDCPGMNQGKRHDAELIRITSANDGTSALRPRPGSSG